MNPCEQSQTPSSFPLVDSLYELQPILNVENEDDLARFLRTFRVDCIPPNVCICQSVMRCYILSFEVLLPLIKMTLRLKDHERKFLTYICRHTETFLAHEPHAYFCNPSNVVSYADKIVDMKSILNIMSIPVLSTYFCSNCGFQRIEQTVNGLICKDICEYASDQLVRHRWKCLTCCSYLHSYVEHKLYPTARMTAFVVFTLKGFKSMKGLIYNPQPPKDLKVILAGRFEMRYIIVESDNSYHFCKYKDRKNFLIQVNGHFTIPTYKDVLRNIQCLPSNQKTLE
ncbi:hypothetical protein RF11_09362 [Thelohanellus kitauei]|uniref:Uncharacterized protein n=1 Tax=Thelohanellus kitauei TaxID=669202 RepID=A0A0C2IXX2_THEKT|nr:hypothetical protein RF11_09362 [Thelohanellus kitauei]